MQKLLFVISTVLLSVNASAVYQIYDFQMKLKTTKPVKLALPAPLCSYYLPDVMFRVMVTENIKGYLVCNGPYNLDRPDFVYLKNTSTGESFSTESGLRYYWDVYDRLSPSDKSVEVGWNFWWTASNNHGYDVYGAGAGKIKAAKYKKVYSQGTRKVTIADGMKGEITGTKYLPRVYGVAMDGESEMCNENSVIHGTWKIKYNNRLSMALYRFSAFPVSGGTGACSAGSPEDEDSGVVSTAEIKSILGL